MKMLDLVVGEICRDPIGSGRQRLESKSTTESSRRPIWAALSSLAHLDPIAEKGPRGRGRGCSFGRLSGNFSNRPIVISSGL